MSEAMELTIHYEVAEGDQVVARIVEVPAAVSFGRSREEAREAVLDALRELVLSYLEDAPGAEPREGEDEVVRIHAASS